MSWWRKLLGRRGTDPPYGLHPDNPILCGGGIEAEFDYLQRLRCPAGKPVEFQRRGAVIRTCLTYLDRPDVQLRVSRGALRRVAEADPHELPLDDFLIACQCGQHHERIFIDMYFRGPELPIGAGNWNLAAGVSPAETFEEAASCPYCGEELRTPQAKQCRFCKMDWHDPSNVRRRESKKP